MPSVNNNINSIINNISSVTIKNRSIIYVRSSTKNQNNEYNNSASLEMQIFSCENFAKQNNLDIISIEKEICSARKGSNQKVLKSIIENNNNINLMVFDISRFSRNHFDGTKMLKHCLEKGITIYSVKDNLFVKDLRDIQSFTNLLISAQAESDAISHRVLQSIEYRKSLGAYFGKEKFGYSIIKENNIKKLVPLLDEIQVINLIQKLYYGCQKCEIEDLLLTINKQKTKIKIPDILLYGNYSSADVAYFLNLHSIFKRGEQWTTYTINKVINQNVKYINKKYNLTDNLIDELITIISNKSTSDISKNVRTINQLFLEINGYKLTEKLETYKTFKTRWDIMNFLNKYHVNFRVWTIDDIEEIEQPSKKSKRSNSMDC
jgi:DNA invertase Pin-like site-specific DNA recombinase